MPLRASLALVVILPFLLRATPYGIFLPSLAATLILPLLILDIDESNINGFFLDDGKPNAIGLVPNKLLFAPYGAIAGGVILLFLLLGIVSRSIRKRANKKTAEQPAIELDDEPEQDEFDDLFSDLDDIEIDTDEFEDLLDEF